jgi:hypothetical protein
MWCSYISKSVPAIQGTARRGIGRRGERSYRFVPSISGL